MCYLGAHVAKGLSPLVKCEPENTFYQVVLLVCLSLARLLFVLLILLIRVFFCPQLFLSSFCILCLLW